ncbi:MAG: sugar phosphate isomerase/epimerase family protein [Planctomycetota bacterium]
MKTKRARQINYWTLGGFEGEKPVEKVLVEAREMGYEGVELCFGAGVFGPETPEAVVRGYRDAAKKLGLQITTLATGVHWNLSLGSPDAAERKKAVEFTRAYLQAASWVGAKAVLVIPGAVDVAWDASRPVVPARAVWTNAARSIRSLLPLAKKLRVVMAVENVWNKFLTGPFEMKLFVDQFHSPYVGCYFDVANCRLNGYPEHWIEILGRRIKAVHLKNFSLSDCAGGLHGFGDDLLTGDVNLKSVIAALDKAGYRGPLTAEMVPFSRLPDLVLPDLDLARKTAGQLLAITS